MKYIYALIFSFSVVPVSFYGFTDTQTSIMVIPPKDRANDIIESFDLLSLVENKRDICITLTSGEIIKNIDKITLLTSGTLLNIEIFTSKGIQSRIVPIETFQEINSAS